MFVTGQVLTCLQGITGWCNKLEKHIQPVNTSLRVTQLNDVFESTQLPPITPLACTFTYHRTTL